MGFVVRATPSQAPEPYVVPPSKEFDGNDGSWSTFMISVGTPGQDFRVLPSTKGGVTYVIAPEGCIADVDPADCATRRGVGAFDISPSSGFDVDISTTWSAIGQYDVDLEETHNYTGIGLFGFDKVSLGSAADSASLSVDHQVVAGVADLDYFLGILPLGLAQASFSSLSQSIDSFMYSLRNSTKIPSLSYGYTAGAKYRLKSVMGSLILGGYDSTRFKPNDNDISFTFSNDPSKLLTIGVQSIMATDTLKGTFSLTSGAHTSVIDSTLSQLWLPQAICDQFEEAFGLTYDPTTEFYLVNDTIHEELLAKNPTVTIKLVNSLENTVTNYTNIQLPYGAFDLQASYPHYQNATNYFPIRRATDSSKYALGRTLLQEAYLIVDYERERFTVAQAVFPDPLPAAKVVTIEPPTHDDSKETPSSGLSIGAIAGIAVGGAVVLILILVLAFVYRKRRNRKRVYELATATAHEQSPTPHSDIELTHQKATGAHEMAGTPLMELAAPYDARVQQEQKDPAHVYHAPQELHATPMTTTPDSQQWHEVEAPLHTQAAYEMDGTSSVSGRTANQTPTHDRYADSQPQRQPGHPR